MENERSCIIILSEGIEQVPHQNGMITKIVQPVLKFKLPFLPSALSFHISVITTGYQTDKGILFGYEIRKKGGDIINKQEKQQLPAMQQKFDNFNINIEARNVAFIDPGVYEVFIQLNEDTKIQEFLLTADEIYSHGSK